MTGENKISKEKTFSEYRKERLTISQDKDGDYNVKLDGRLLPDAWKTKEEAEDYGDNELSEKLAQEKNERIINEQYKNTKRYSIAYFNSSYDKTFRAEIYTNMKRNEKVIERQLKVFLHKKVSELNPGLQALFKRASFIGFEAEDVGQNDVGNSSLNRFYFYTD